VSTYYLYLREGTRFSVEADSIEDAIMAFQMLICHYGLEGGL
jgi:hypothetical protein